MYAERPALHAITPHTGVSAAAAFPFRYFLPLMQLLLCFALLWPHLPRLRSQLAFAIESFNARTMGTEPPAGNPSIVLDVTPVTPAADHRWDISALRLTMPAALNIPVGFVQIPLIAGSGSEWAPTGMWIREWRAVSWPFVGMIFWWMAGRGLESLSAGTRFFMGGWRSSGVRPVGVIHPALHWVEVMIGALLIVTGVATCYLLGWGEGMLGLTTDYVLAAGAGMWAALGLVIVSAAILQSRVRKAQRREWLAAGAG